MKPRIPFNKPFIVGKELEYIAEAVTKGNIGGDGQFTQACSRLLEQRFAIRKALLTPSCTAALEMIAMLLDLKPGDEIIVPSFTFVSTANAFVRLGARPVFVDVRADTLNLDERLVEVAITARTRAICAVHYAGVACEMDALEEIAARRGVTLVEDAAQGVHAAYRGRSLGSIGALGAYSFHETKNYICGEGGALCINEERYLDRAEVLRDKGTNRQRFFRGEVDKYTWINVGSSYVPSEINGAFLAQLERLDAIAQQRRRVYEYYLENLRPLERDGLLRLPTIPEHCASNYHMFHVLAPNHTTREGLRQHLRSRGILAVFHYVPLHTSPMGLSLGGREGTLPVTEEASARLLRLPLYHEITEREQSEVVAAVTEFLRSRPDGSRAPTNLSSRIS